MNIQKMLKQAQAMQAKMAEAQEALAQKTLEASSGGGKVTATVNGAGDLLALQIDPSVVDPEDVEFLQDLIVKAIQDAATQAKNEAQSEMGKLTAGLNIPGLPF
jgi:DNA-binding YbaB/EbfC family protein